jgi:imidazolonepropionase-like amidohydrolase
MRTLYRDAALTDARSDQLQMGTSVLVEDGRIAWIRPTDGEPDPGDATIIDAGGTTIVPGLVDSHSHLTLPGGSHWIDRGLDPPEHLLAVAEHNADLQRSAGVRWARDVGSPTKLDPTDGRERALALGVRDRWWQKRGRPYVRAAGSWVARTDYLPAGLAVDVSDADELVAEALHQLDDGADFVKVMMDGPDPERSPWSAEELRRVVEAVHQRGARVTCHATTLDGTSACIEAGVDSIEHGFAIDDDMAARMAERGIALSTTLAIFRSWLGFATTTRLERFAGQGSAARIAERYERAKAGVLSAHRAGVLIAAGTDFGGGSTRANQMAWEVESLAEAGLEPWEALACATWHGGQILGEPSAGAIEEGGPADFFLVHGDPLSDPTALWRVWLVAWS